MLQCLRYFMTILTHEKCTNKKICLEDKNDFLLLLSFSSSLIFFFLFSAAPQKNRAEKSPFSEFRLNSSSSSTIQKECPKWHVCLMASMSRPCRRVALSFFCCSPFERSFRLSLRLLLRIVEQIKKSSTIWLSYDLLPFIQANMLRATVWRVVNFHDNGDLFYLSCLFWFLCLF